MTNFKRYDKNLVKAMIAYIKRLRIAAAKRKKPITMQDIYFAVVMKFRPTSREICAALWQWLIQGEPNAEWMNTYVQFRRIFNTYGDPDNEVIGVKEPTLKNGKRGSVWIEVMASGKDAHTASEENKKPRDGYDKKIDRLEAKSKDKKLRQRHVRHLHEIEGSEQDSNEGHEETK